MSLLSLVLVALAALAALVAGGRGIWLSIVALCSAVALATLAWTGHGAMDEAVMGWVHLIVDILHLIASGAWVGALLGLLLLVSRPAARVDAAHLGLTHRALHGFGAIGTVVVGTILVTGLVIAAIGAAMMLGLPLGRLPGDIAVKRGAFSFYFPLTTSIVLSVVLTLILAWFRR